MKSKPVLFVAVFRNVLVDTSMLKAIVKPVKLEFVSNGLKLFVPSFSHDIARLGSPASFDTFKTLELPPSEYLVLYCQSRQEDPWVAEHECTGWINQAIANLSMLWTPRGLWTLHLSRVGESTWT